MRISDWSSDVCSSDLASTSRAQLILSLPIRSARASRINLEKHPVKPPPPTGEQLSVPLRPTYSIATARLVQLSFPCALGHSRSASGLQKRTFLPLHEHPVLWSAFFSEPRATPHTKCML